MGVQNQLVKYINNPIKTFINKLLSMITRKYGSSKLIDKDTEAMINLQFPNELEQKEVKELLEDLLTRNHDLSETLNIKILRKDIVELFGKAKLERIVNDSTLQDSILELSEEELKTRKNKKLKSSNIN